MNCLSKADKEGQNLFLYFVFIINTKKRESSIAYLLRFSQKCVCLEFTPAVLLPAAGKYLFTSHGLVVNKP